jgi:thiol-disulfide isomerase/thioredoxin
VNLLSRLGLAVVQPRAALSVAGDRKAAGRSGSDLLVVLLLVVIITQAQRLFPAAWATAMIGPSYGLRAILAILTDTITVPLGFLVISALVIWAASGPRRDLGRASDLACVALLPMLVVDLVANIVVHGIGVHLPPPAYFGVLIAGFMWTGGLVALATLEARRASPAPTVAPISAKRAGWALTALLVLDVILQTVWLVRYFDQMRPALPGEPAPAFTLPRIAAQGTLGEPFSLAQTQGKIVVVDFWATWCNPCMKSMPHLAAFQQKHPEVVVVAVLVDDDPREGRAVFDEARFPMTLVLGDEITKTRYGVGAIPHTVLIDREGKVRKVSRGSKIDLEREISGL